MNDSVQKTLRQIGFSDKSSRVYLALLSLGEASVIEIATQTRLKRTTVYNVLPELIQAGLVRTGRRGKRRIFFVDDVRAISEKMKQDLLTAELLIPRLQGLQQVLPNRPRLQIFEGQSGVRDFFLDTLKHTPRGGRIDEIVGPKAFYSILPAEIRDEYVPMRVKQGVRIRIIASQSETAKRLKQRAAAELREIRFVRRLDIDFHAALVLYGTRVGFLSFTERFFGAVVESSALYEMQRAIFQSLWETLE